MTSGILRKEILGHRILLNYDGQADNVQIPELVAEILREVPEEAGSPAESKNTYAVN